MSVGFLRSESGGQVKMTFTGNISSIGYLTGEEAKLNAIVRAKGGASLNSWSFDILVKCAGQRSAADASDPRSAETTSHRTFSRTSARSKLRNLPSRISRG
jgi:hypothetical protein